MIYLDSAATSFYRPPQVENAMVHALHTIGNSGRGAHAPTLNASRVIYDTREKLARLFGAADPSRVAFTQNVTEALNIAIQGLIHPGDHVISTVCEHNSVLRPLYRQMERGAEDELGRARLDLLEPSLRPQTTAVVLGHASNLTGNVIDLQRVCEFTRRHKLLLILDTAQTAGMLPLNQEEMGIDVLCFTGHKGLMGPQGTGGLCVRPGVEIPSLMTGGSGVHSFRKTHPADMPTALEAGTLNGHGIAGLNAALSFILDTGVEELHRREDAQARRFAEGVRHLPGVTVYGDLDAPVRAPIVALNIRDYSSAEVGDMLWEDAQICVRAGAHCAPRMHEALGTVEQGAVRFSFSSFNTEEQTDRAIRAVAGIAEEE